MLKKKQVKKQAKQSFDQPPDYSPQAHKKSALTPPPVEEADGSTVGGITKRATRGAGSFKPYEAPKSQVADPDIQSYEPAQVENIQARGSYSVKADADAKTEELRKKAANDEGIMNMLTKEANNTLEFTKDIAGKIGNIINISTGGLAEHWKVDPDGADEAGEKLGNATSEFSKDTEVRQKTLDDFRDKSAKLAFEGNQNAQKALEEVNKKNAELNKEKIKQLDKLEKNAKDFVTTTKDTKKQLLDNTEKIKNIGEVDPSRLMNSYSTWQKILFTIASAGQGAANVYTGQDTATVADHILDLVDRDIKLQSEQLDRKRKGLEFEQNALIKAYDLTKDAHLAKNTLGMAIIDRIQNTIDGNLKSLGSQIDVQKLQNEFFIAASRLAEDANSKNTKTILGAFKSTTDALVNVFKAKSEKWDAITDNATKLFSEKRKGLTDAAKIKVDQAKLYQKSQADKEKRAVDWGKLSAEAWHKDNVNMLTADIENNKNKIAQAKGTDEGKKWRGQLAEKYHTLGKNLDFKYEKLSEDQRMEVQKQKMSVVEKALGHEFAKEMQGLREHEEYKKLNHQQQHDLEMERYKSALRMKEARLKAELDADSPAANKNTEAYDFGGSGSGLVDPDKSGGKTVWTSTRKLNQSEREKVQTILDAEGKVKAAHDFQEKTIKLFEDREGLKDYVSWVTKGVKVAKLSDAGARFKSSLTSVMSARTLMVATYRRSIAGGGTTSDKDIAMIKEAIINLSFLENESGFIKKTQKLLQSGHFKGDLAQYFILSVDKSAGPLLGYVARNINSASSYLNSIAAPNSAKFRKVPDVKIGDRMDTNKLYKFFGLGAKK